MSETSAFKKGSAVAPLLKGINSGISLPLIRHTRDEKESDYFFVVQSNKIISVSIFDGVLNHPQYSFSEGFEIAAPFTLYATKLADDKFGYLYSDKNGLIVTQDFIASVTTHMAFIITDLETRGTMNCKLNGNRLSVCSGSDPLFSLIQKEPGRAYVESVVDSRKEYEYIGALGILSSSASPCVFVSSDSHEILRL
ncbi:MAG: hypothetical protein ABR981_00115 [Candidatus Micrarchaeaceae archaeon]|jgi:hypothetical protein